MSSFAAFASCEREHFLPSALSTSFLIGFGVASMSAPTPNSLSSSMIPMCGGDDAT